MSETNTPMRHDTRNPLACCARCHKAELLGRGMCTPVFHYEKVEDETRASYRVFHGEHHVATVSRAPGPGKARYAVLTEWDADGEQIVAGSLRDARDCAEEQYITVWREGRYDDRGPVRAP